jgi:hypothetical protein
MTADRSNLQRAHAELRAAEDRLAKIEATLAEGWGDLAERRATAERALADARNAEPSRWVDALVEGKPRPDAVAIAEAACREAIAAEESHTERRRMLRAEAQRQQDVVEAARRRLRLEIAATVMASPEAQALVEEHARCERRMRDIAATIFGAPIPGCFDAPRIVFHPGAGGTPDPAWAAALAALEADPTAPLPSTPNAAA